MYERTLKAESANPRVREIIEAEVDGMKAIGIYYCGGNFREVYFSLDGAYIDEIAYTR